MKVTGHKSYGKLIPLNIPNCPWKVVEIDLITNISTSSSNIDYSIMISCDILTKMVHLDAFPDLLTANEAAVAFLKSVFITWPKVLPNCVLGSMDSSKF